MKVLSALSAVALTMAASSAFAQAASSPDTTSPASPMGGITMGDPATMAVRYANVQPADMMSSKLIGANIYNKQNENVGEIEYLVIKDGNTITGVVASVGGFLGIGDSYVVLDPSTVVVNQKDGTWKAYADTSKDDLSTAPKFTYSKMK